MATIYWNKNNGESYVDMNSLPIPAKGKQYQLWVIQGGKPVSMGVLATSVASTPELQKIATLITSGDAFAISLEKEGGNPTPTEVCVVGRYEGGVTTGLSGRLDPKYCKRPLARTKQILRVQQVEDATEADHFFCAP